MDYQISDSDALIIVDPQNDFCPGGPLAVEGGNEIMAPIAALANRFREARAAVVVTQDWHPRAHKSFASAQGRDPFTTIQMAYGEQVLWPDHCVEGSVGAEFHPDLHHGSGVNAAALILRKGRNPEIDSYSAFYENDPTITTGLGAYLNAMGVRRVFLVGLAYDFCVAYSALDAVQREGLDAVVLKDLTRAIAMPLQGNETTVDAMETRFRDAGVVVTTTAAVL